MTEDGLRFRPTDAELLKMLRQFTDGEYTGGLVERRDLYAHEEPWEICTGRGTAAAEDNTWYFFTELKRKPANKRPGKRFIRSVGKGTWHGTSKVETIFNPERKQSLLGFKRNFTYWGDDEERKGEFVMNEFSLPEGTAKSDRKDFVVCRLKRKKRGPIHNDNDVAAEDAPRMMLLSQEQENNNDDAAEDAPRMMLLSREEEEGNNNNNNTNDEDVSFSYDELFGGMEVEDMTAAPGPALLQQDAGSNETYPYACTTNTAAAVADPLISGVSGDTTWTLEMVEDFLLKDGDDDVGGREAAASAAVAIQEDNKADDEWILSMLDDFEVQHGGSGSEHNSFDEFPGGGSVASPGHMSFGHNFDEMFL
ncbi:unnamed protein product [Cuscuta campestris]|uniref:NAC domain-containing protein n=1 Tax=Cuscuta campestris TaxID=132261 RepID=A0A484KQ47_9ASTE|nr:unnamed protein product [Cuscuta campestris]